MTTVTEGGQATLVRRLREALELADALGLDMAAIHIDEALSSIEHALPSPTRTVSVQATVR